VDELVVMVSNSFQRAPWGWGLLATVVIGLIRAWPILAKQAIDAKAQLRQERRDDLKDYQRRLEAMGVRIDSMSSDLNNLKIELAATISAYRILEIEVEAVNPASIGLAEARAILSAAFTVAPAPVRPRDGAARGGGE